MLGRQPFASPRSCSRRTTYARPELLSSDQRRQSGCIAVRHISKVRVSACVMILEHIEIKPSDVGWPQAAPLLKAVWPPGVVAKLPWRDVVWANPDLRLLAFNRDNEVICHLAIVLRDATWDGRAVSIGGIGGLATREDSRRQGVASAAMGRAIREIQETYKADFGLLFCEPRHASLYVSLGWRSFGGEVFVSQPPGRVRFDATDPRV
jgi:aminoglycoside 2'-N-acetyltransferase I